MPIKRVTIEIDDTADSSNLTNVPSSLTGRETVKTKKGEPTSTPTYNDSTIEQKTSEEGTTPTITTGRTLSDLVSEFINNPRAMATILMFIPFIVFAAKIQSLKDMLYPLITGAILNTVWFCIPLVITIYKRTAKQMNK